MYKIDLQTESSVTLYVNNDLIQVAKIQYFIKSIHQKNCNKQFCQCEQRKRHYAIVQQIITDVTFVA